MNTTFPNGKKKKECIIQLMPRTFQSDPFGGTATLEYDRLLVWADANLREAFYQIEGVTQVVTAEFANRYVLAIDPRYDVEYIKREVEAVALGVESKAQFKYNQASGPIWKRDWFLGGES